MDDEYVDLAYCRECGCPIYGGRELCMGCRASIVEGPDWVDSSMPWPGFIPDQDTHDRWVAEWDDAARHGLLTMARYEEMAEREYCLEALERGLPIV